MATETMWSKLRTFLGLHQVPPRNEFRNPIWGSDDDDDGDELYTRDAQRMQHFDERQLLEVTRHMQDMFKAFGGIFGDMKSFFHFDDDQFFNDNFNDDLSINKAEEFDSNSIRQYYLKPGYHKNELPEADIDLDGKVSSEEISGMLKKGSDHNIPALTPFEDSLVPSMPPITFSQTVITRITKPDGTIETKKIIKRGNEVIEETTTTVPDMKGPNNPGISPTGSVHIFSDLGSLFKNFY